MVFDPCRVEHRTHCVLVTRCLLEFHGDLRGNQGAARTDQRLEHTKPARSREVRQRASVKHENVHNARQALPA